MKQITLIHVLLYFLISAFFFIPAISDSDLTLPLVQELKFKGIDIRFNIRGERKTSGNVVIAGIESRGFEAYGRWPWPRSVFAKLLVRLKESGAKTIVFDLLFSEKEDNKVPEAVGSLKKTYKELNLLKDDFNSQIFFDEMSQLIDNSDNDSLFSQSVDWSGNVILGMAFETEKQQKIKEESIQITEKALYKIDLKNSLLDNRLTFFEKDRISFPINTLEKTAVSIGYVNVFPDEDGTIRKIKSTIISQKFPFMPLAVAAAGNYLDLDPLWYPSGILKIGDRKIEFDDSGSVYIDFYGSGNPFVTFSIADIIDGHIPPNQLNGKVVIVGSMATGIGDIWPTPLSGGIPGVIVQATFIDNIIQQSNLKIPRYEIIIQCFTIVLMSAIPLILILSLSPLIATLAGFFFLLCYAAFVQYLFVEYKLIWPAVLPLGAGVSSILIFLVHGFVIEAKQHIWIKNSFSRYLSSDVIDILIKDPSKLSLGGIEQEVTVMMVDIRDFTSLSEGLAPNELIKLLNLYLGELTDVILENGGTVDKYMGDAIMAFFGAPINDPLNASKACKTATMMFERLHEKRIEWSLNGLPTLWIGIGLNTGEVVVGNLGCSRRFDYSVIGDHVNLASRLEGLSKVYGVKILISEYTRNNLGTNFNCRELDKVRVKGRQEPVRIYELLGKDYFTNGAYSFVESFERGLFYYREGSFSKAIECFEETLLLKPHDKPSQLFIQRCNTLEKEELQSNWDGTCTFTQK
ncbi:MAG: CHASE2 domain-containing protein [Desulfamplus sp.]|nr:CHASE2 domain-containing protein [Desulfamplus sp.]